MALSKINPQQTDIWKKLTAHFEETKGTHLRTLFSSDANRAEKFTLQWNDFLFDSGPPTPVNLDSKRTGKHRAWLKAGCRG